MLLTFAPPEKFIFLTSFVTEKLVVVVATLHVKMKTYWRTIVTTILPTHDSGGFVVLSLPTPPLYRWSRRALPAAVEAGRSELSVGIEGGKVWVTFSLCLRVCVLAPDELAQSSMTQLLTTPHFAGINGGPAGGRQTASNERRTLSSSQTRKRCVFASSLNLLLCCMLSETVLYVHFFFSVMYGCRTSCAQ